MQQWGENKWKLVYQTPCLSYRTSRMPNKFGFIWADMELRRTGGTAINSEGTVLGCILQLRCTSEIPRSIKPLHFHTSVTAVTAFSLKSERYSAVVIWYKSFWIAAMAWSGYRSYWGLLNVLLVNLKGIGVLPFYCRDCGFESLFRKYTTYEEFMNRNSHTVCIYSSIMQIAN
jgi:hypothetical protein